jgi:iron complex transport system substrate-binding protein
MKTKTKTIALVEIAIVLCSVFLAAPAIVADQTTQKAITTASEDEFTLGIYGNANEDDTIDMRDTTYIKLVIFGKKPKTDLADANYDGKVSMLDVGQTKLIILGKEKKLTLIDLADRIVTIDKPFEKVVPLFNFEEYLAVEGGKNPFEKIVGWTSGYWEGRRQWIWEKYTNAFPEIDDIPDVGYIYKGTFSAEKVISLDPDVVIMTVLNYERAKDDISKLEQAGIPTICVDYHIQTIEAHAKSTLMLGYMLDKEERAIELVDFYTEQVNKVYSRLDEIDKPKPKVYVECASKGPSTYGNTYGNYMWGALIENCGGINIADGVIVKYAPINPEYLLDTNPDVIILTGSYWPATPDSMRLGYYAAPEESIELLKAFTERPGWDTLNAVNNNRVHSIQHGLSRHIYDFVAVQYFAKCFYPDEFEDLDPEENFKEFHERFMPVDYSGVWMLSLEE